MAKTYRYIRKNELKDKKINFARKEKVFDDFGTPIGEDYVPIFQNVWAYARQASSQEVVTGIDIYGKDMKIEVLFIINYRKGIKEDMIIEFEGKRYSIVEIDYFDYSKKDMRITGKTFMK